MVVIPEMLLVHTAYQWQSKPLKHTQFRMVVVFFPVTHMASRNIERLWGRGRWQVPFLHSPPSLYRSRWPGALEDKASRRCSRQNRQITRNLHENWTKKQPWWLICTNQNGSLNIHVKILFFFFCNMWTCVKLLRLFPFREAGRTGRGRGVSNAKRARTNTPTDGRSAR